MCISSEGITNGEKAFILQKIDILFSCLYYNIKETKYNVKITKRYN